MASFHHAQPAATLVYRDKAHQLQTVKVSASVGDDSAIDGPVASYVLAQKAHLLSAERVRA